MLNALSETMNSAVKALDGQEESWDRLQAYLRSDSEQEVKTNKGCGIEL